MFFYLDSFCEFGSDHIDDFGQILKFSQRLQALICSSSVFKDLMYVSNFPFAFQFIQPILIKSRSSGIKFFGVGTSTFYQKSMSLAFYSISCLALIYFLWSKRSDRYWSCIAHQKLIKLSYYAWMMRYDKQIVLIYRETHITDSEFNSAEEQGESRRSAPDFSLDYQIQLVFD